MVRWDNVLQVCALARVFGLYPFSDSARTVYLNRYLLRLWAHLIYPLSALFLVSSSRCPILESIFFLCQLYYCLVFVKPINGILDRLPFYSQSTDYSIPWWTVAVAPSIIQLPLYLVKDSKGSLQLFLWETIFSSPVRIYCVLYIGVSYSLTQVLLSFKNIFLKFKNIEGARYELHKILIAFHYFHSNFEPFVAFIFIVLGCRILTNIFYLLWDERLMDYKEVVSFLLEIPFLIASAMVTNSQLALIEEISGFLISQRLKNLDSNSRDQLIYFLKMINDNPRDEYVAISNTSISLFAGFMTTYFITIIQLLPQLKAGAEYCFKYCKI